jgi:hypothetical protein
MNKYNIFTLICLFGVSLIQAQNSFSDTKYGLRVEYKSEKKKGDKYMLYTTVINNSGKDLYYVKELNSFNSQTYCVIVKSNGDADLSENGTFVKGELTKYVTTEGGQIYKIKASDVLKAEAEVKAPRGKKIEFSLEYPNQMKDFSELNIDYLSPTTVDGLWISDCGKFQFGLKITKTAGDKLILTQMINAREFVYEYMGNYRFQRKDNIGYSLTFAKDGNSFFYTADDGVSCNWTRKE